MEVNVQDQGDKAGQSLWDMAGGDVYTPLVSLEDVQSLDDWQHMIKLIIIVN